MVNSKLYNMLQYIVIVLIILQCNSVFIGMHNIVSNLLSILSFSMIVFLSINTLCKYRVSKSFYYNLIFTVTIFFLTIAAFLFIEYFFIYEFKILPIFLWLISIPIMIIFFSIMINYKDLLVSFFEKYILVVTFISAISIIFLLLYNLGLPTNSAISSGWTGYINGYYYLFFVYQKGSMFGLRNSSIFTEPVIFGFIIVSALIVYFFILNKNIRDNPSKVIILYFTVITTNSSNAIIISVVILIFYFIQKINFRTIFFSIPIFLIGYYIINSIYISKQNANIYSSYAIRINDIYACFNAWLSGNILFGNGFDNFSNIFKYVYSYRAMTGVVGLSTGFFWMLVSGGLFLILFTVLPCFVLAFRNRRLFLASIMLNIYTVYGIVNQSYLYAMFIALFWSLVIIRNDKFFNLKE